MNKQISIGIRMGDGIWMDRCV